jgi:uncharacterized membrane protein
VTKVNTKAAAVLLGVFVLGAVAGAGGAFAYTRDEVRALADQPGMREVARLRALSRALDLTDAQERELRHAMERHRKDRRAVWMKAMEKCGEPIRRQKAELDGEIRKVLNDDQRARFDRFVDDHRPMPQAPDGP